MQFTQQYFNSMEQHNILEQAVNRSVIRLKWILAFFVLAFFVLILRIFDLTFMNIEEVQVVVNNKAKNDFTISRANIVDRNSVLLASNITTASVYTHPKQVINPQEAAESIASIGIGLNQVDLLNKLTSDKDFIWIKRHLTPEEQQKLHDLGIPGIYFARDERRVYPHEKLFSHVLGYVDIDGVGIAGIEKLYNDKLTTNVNYNTALQLSLDTRVQNILRDELQKSIELHTAIGGSGIVMNVKNGEIIGMVSLPDFDPHHINHMKSQELFNQATLGVYEMGSSFKVLTVAMALDIGKINVNDAFDVSQPINIGRFKIHDYRGGKGGTLSIPEILMYSSNLGSAQIARLVGIKSQKEYLRKMGLLSEIKFDLPEIAKPLYPNDRRWSDASLITISYGHGIAVTPLHLMQAMGAVVNGGILYKPTLIKQKEGVKPVGKRVFNESTSHIMRKLLRLVVEGGSSKKAEVVGYLVGGKTGTAEKNSQGRYSKKLNISFFVGAFPINNPEYLMLIMIDEAKPNNINMGFTTGGMIAAPVGREVIMRAAPVLGILPQDQQDPEILKALYVDYTPRYKKVIAKR